MKGKKGSRSESESGPQRRRAVCVSACHELMSTGLVDGAEVLRGVPAEGFTTPHI